MYNGYADCAIGVSVVCIAMKLNITLSRVGGSRPCEVRQPACFVRGKVPIPAALCREMRGCKAFVSPISQDIGFFIANRS